MINLSKLFSMMASACKANQSTMMDLIVSQVIIVWIIWANNIESTSSTTPQAPSKFQAKAICNITVESHCKIPVQMMTAVAPKQLGNQPAWWFTLNGSKDNKSSRSCLFDTHNHAPSKI